MGKKGGFGDAGFRGMDRRGGRADGDALPLSCDSAICRGCDGTERWDTGGCAERKGGIEGHRARGPKRVGEAFAEIGAVRVVPGKGKNRGGIWSCRLSQNNDMMIKISVILSGFVGIYSRPIHTDGAGSTRIPFLTFLKKIEF